MTTLFNFINGELCTPKISDFLESQDGSYVLDALTLDPVSVMSSTDTETMDMALQIAHSIDASKSWQNNRNKTELFARLANEMEPLISEFALADCRDVGTLMSTANGLNGYGPLVCRNLNYLVKDKCFEWKELLENGKVVGKMKHVPVGPIVVLAPTNAPLGSALIQVLRGLACGNPVIVKPSPWSPNSFNLLARAFIKADFPKGVFQICHGGMEVGKYLVGSPLVKAICFTGSTKGGFEIAKSCATTLKPIAMEMSGCNPFIVLKGADLKKAVETLVQSLTMINGQYCCGPSKVIVHKDELNPFIELFRSRVSQLVFGNPQDENTTLGPICVGLLKSLKGQIEYLLSRDNSYAITGTDLKIPNVKGTFIPPTLIFMDTNVSMELFGPIATLHSVKSVSEAILLANQTDAILKAYVFGKVSETAMVIESVETCWIDENEFDRGTPGLKEPHSWGGFSGFGHATPDFFVKTVYVRN
ncbi:hypothetical protein HK103_007044 [Boothiomyces macroporosus]|uniref:Aldehyde dehydrogenase domain-containing protein n=1 Tax=Boothiomyces macroporosus TaxID=261099 RepID=A0AAD5Y6M7_9FUNG|nr:hypothetical protein HK103_007044 [Boothiomyces macroporosus]